MLKRLRESESVVPPGDPLIEIGDPHQLEIVADLLSTDAVRVKPGARTIVEQWGGEKPLEARVRRIEPAGFTKISALGVEEQRVNVVLDFTIRRPRGRRLATPIASKCALSFGRRPSVLKVPTSALFRDGEKWAVYVVENGARAARSSSSDTRPARKPR